MVAVGALNLPLIGAMGRIQPDKNLRDHICSRMAILESDPTSILHRVPFHSHPARCIDGRPFTVEQIDLQGVEFPVPCGELPRGAGGTAATWVIDLLTTTAFRPHSSFPGSAVEADELRALTPTWLSLTCAALQRQGIPVGTHGDDRSHGGDCGCGAVDRLGSILALIGQAHPTLFSLLEQWGFDPRHLPASLPNRCARYAMTVPSGSGISGILKGHASAAVPSMQGRHAEVAVVVNLIPGTVVDTAAVGRFLVANEDGAWRDAESSLIADPRQSLPDPRNPQVFAVDPWSFWNVADFLVAHADPEAGATETGLLVLPREITREAVATTLMLLNCATLMTLCGSGMPVMVLRPDPVPAHQLPEPKMAPQPTPVDLPANG